MGRALSLVVGWFLQVAGGECRVCACLPRAYMPRHYDDDVALRHGAEAAIWLHRVGDHARADKV